MNITSRLLAEYETPSRPPVAEYGAPSKVLPELMTHSKLLAEYGTPLNLLLEYTVPDRRASL